MRSHHPGLPRKPAVSTWCPGQARGLCGPDRWQVLCAGWFPRMLVRSRLRWASALPGRRQSPGIRGRGGRRVPLIPSAATGNVASFSEADAAVDRRLIRRSVDAYPHRLVTGTIGLGYWHHWGCADRGVLCFSPSMWSAAAVQSRRPCTAPGSTGAGRLCCGRTGVFWRHAQRQ